MADDKNKDILLHPDTYVFLQNEGKNGIVNVFVGPGVVNQTGQDRPVIYDQDKKSYRHTSLDQAVQQFPRAKEGDYVILENPADDDNFPNNSVQQSATLKKGRKIVVPGPWSHALWPGQGAKVVPGHRLRSNQYLVVVIYNEDEAKKNWNNAIVKAADDGKEFVAKGVNFSVGQRIIIKGTEVSFYIPPTGVEVQADENGNYVRDAVTLEQLEYCILVDEQGKKRFPRGPAVIFPEPTEQFLADDHGNRKFRALELNNIQGIHVKVTESYREGDREYKEGEELFITGKDTSIYFLRPEHSIISYGNNNLKHYATAIPAGEARYVMDRNNGDIKLTTGPKMLLPDPRNEVIVRRILSRNQCELWYPGNNEAVEYNENLRLMSANSPSSRSGFVSEGDYQRGTGQHLASVLEAAESLSQVKSLAAFGNIAPAPKAGNIYTGGQKFDRSQTYTQPRTVTLDTKYDGVPAVNVWTGYAVQIVSKTGKRRVEVGPANILLGYDETLEVLTLSTGKPKNTDTLMKTVYLRVKNNKVSDFVDVETSDHVPAKVKVSLCVNFEGDPTKWFDVENYVKFLCDHVRSILKGVVKKRTVEDFYANYLPIIRDALLGVKKEGEGRPGLAFSENGMRVTDVEVLDVTLGNTEIAKLLSGMQYNTVHQNIVLHQARKNLEVTKEQELIAKEEADAKFATEKHRLELEAQKVAEQLTVEIKKIESNLEVVKQKNVLSDEEQNLIDVAHNAALERSRKTETFNQSVSEKKQELKLAELGAETKAAVERLNAAKESLSEALVTLGRQDLLVKVAEAMKIETFLSGSSLEATLGKIFTGMPILSQIFEKAKTAPAKKAETLVKVK